MRILLQSDITTVFGGSGIRRLRLLLLAGVLAVGGCLSGPAQTDQFYQLELPDPERQFDSPPLKGTIQVKRPWANALTEERPLLYRENSESTEVHRHTYHRWVDSPSNMLQREIARYLRMSHLADQVVTAKLRVKVDYILSCQILKLERIVDGAPRAVMELELGITSIKDNQVLLLQTYREEQSANGDGIDASVVTFTQALSTILNRFLVDSSKLAESAKATNRP